MDVEHLQSSAPGIWSKKKQFQKNLLYHSLQLCMPDSKLNYLLTAEMATEYNTRNTQKFPLSRKKIS